MLSTLLKTKVDSTYQLLRVILVGNGPPILWVRTLVPLPAPSRHHAEGYVRPRVYCTPSICNSSHEQLRILWVLSTTRTTSCLRRVRHSAANATPSCTRTSPTPLSFLLFSRFTRAVWLTICVPLRDIGFSWCVLSVRESYLKGIPLCSSPTCWSIAVVTLADPLPLPVPT